MNKYEIKKVENCFKDSQTYEYKLNIALDKKIIDKFYDLGNIEIKEFRRPIFMITCKDSTKIKGVINSNIIRVSFNNNTWQESKVNFEEFLDKILY